MTDKLGVEVRYLFNSGFTVKTAARLLVFDYSPVERRKKPDADAGGLLTASELAPYDVTVFVSHRHGDHYTPEIFTWAHDVSRIQYVLSSDVRMPPTPPEKRIVAEPDKMYEAPGMTIRTLRSTDEGVAFIVETDGLKIYHAGDLNWWHWAGEPDDENAAMAAAYKQQIDKLRDEVFDLAFVPVDLRLRREYLWGLDYFMSVADARVVVPMHFQNRHTVFDKLMKDPKTEKYRGRIVKISHRGEVFEL